MLFQLMKMSHLLFISLEVSEVQAAIQEVQTASGVPKYDLTTPTCACCDVYVLTSQKDLQVDLKRHKYLTMNGTSMLLCLNPVASYSHLASVCVVKY